VPRFFPEWKNPGFSGKRIPGAAIFHENRAKHGERLNLLNYKQFQIKTQRCNRKKFDKSFRIPLNSAVRCKTRSQLNPDCAVIASRRCLPGAVFRRLAT
jgi:hypothetical protein